MPFILQFNDALGNQFSFVYFVPLIVIGKQSLYGQIEIHDRKVYRLID